MVKVEHLCKSYGNKNAVIDISFEVEKGEILGFLGPNAAGKSTTMRILTGFLAPTSGRAVVAGYDIAKHPLEVRRRLGYLPESVPFYPDMRTREFLEFSASLKGLSGAKRTRQVDKAMDECGISNVALDLIGRLSKGYRQRVGLAQALVADPPVLILDEPTVGLDPRQIIEIRQLIKGLAGEHTIILSTHILPEVSMTCERVIIINQGRLVASDTPDNLTKQLEKSSTVIVQAEGDYDDVLKVLRQTTGVESASVQEKRRGKEATYLVKTEKDTDVRAALSERIVKKGFGLLEIRFQTMTLEDIFIQLVTEEKPSAVDGEGEDAA